MNSIAELGDRLAKLSREDARDLRLLMLDRFQIDVPHTSAVQPDEPTPEPAQPTEFSVFLDGYDHAKKIGIIKAFRELTGQGLAEAKSTVERLGQPVKQSVDYRTAEEMRKKLEAAGATVSIKPA